MGRPTLYTPELAQDIFARIAEGETLCSICSDDDMPAASTVRGWIAEDRDGISALSARAYKAGRAAIADDCIRIADAKDEDAQTKRVRIDTRLRLLGKWAPNEWGDRLALEHDVSSNLADQMKAARERAANR